jgi:hypothetical protein
MGFKMCIDATTVILLAMQAVRKGLEHYLKHGFPPEYVVNDRETRKYVERVIGLPKLYDIEAKTVFSRLDQPLAK